MSWLDRLMGTEAQPAPTVTFEGKPAYLGKPQDTPERVKARLEQLREAIKEATGDKLAELKAEQERLEAHARHCAKKFADIVAESERLESEALYGMQTKEGKKGKGKGKGK